MSFIAATEEARSRASEIIKTGTIATVSPASWERRLSRLVGELRDGCQNVVETGAALREIVTAVEKVGPVALTRPQFQNIKDMQAHPPSFPTLIVCEIAARANDVGKRTLETACVRIGIYFHPGLR